MRAKNNRVSDRHGTRISRSENTHCDARVPNIRVCAGVNLLSDRDAALVESQGHARRLKSSESQHRDRRDLQGVATMLTGVLNGTS